MGIRSTPKTKEEAKEINKYYRTANLNSWENNPIIVGFEINLSATQNKRANKKRCDLCPIFAGKYPKWFKWNGWCDNCLCFMTPIMLPREGMDKYLELIVTGKDTPENIYKVQEPYLIKDAPKGFMDWVKSNIKTVEDFNNAPYYIKENFKLNIKTKTNTL